MLHTVNLLPEDGRCHDCLEQLHPEDAVLFVGRGVHWAGLGSEALAPWQRSGARLYALRAELTSMGLHGDDAVLPQGTSEIRVIDPSDFVALVCEHATQRAWF